MDFWFRVLEELWIEPESLSTLGTFLSTELLPLEVPFLRVGPAVQLILDSLNSSILLPQPPATGTAGMSHHLWLYCVLDT